MCIDGGKGQSPSQEHKLGGRHDVFLNCKSDRSELKSLDV